MTTIPSAGTTISISSVLTATAVNSDYDEIGEVVSIGEFGKVFTEILHNPIASRRTEKLKGSYNQGNLTIELARDLTDDGQTTCLAALDSDASYSFRIELNNAPSGLAPHGTWFAFDAKVMSFTTMLTGVNSLVGARLAVSIDSDITVTAAAGTGG